MVDDIANKTVYGSLYSGIAAVLTFVLGFARSILLARLLLPEHFGTMALALFFVGLCYVVSSLGLEEAFIHYPGKSTRLKATYFSLSLGLNAIRTTFLLSVAPVLQHLYPQVTELKEVLIALSLIVFIGGLNVFQTTLMRKELAFSSLAITDILSFVVMTIAAPFAAWLGWGIWALVVEQASGSLTRCILIWGPFRQWLARPEWNRQDRDFFWRFAKPIWVKTNINYLLDKFDDFWIGSALGQSSLGYYSKAYDLARAPRRVFALPLLKVFVPVFAHLQQDRKRLSHAFVRCAYLLIRSVFLGAGLFAFIMPEFIYLVIGEKWLPMLWTFRLLLFYAAFDSFLGLINGLLIAVGKPEVLRNAALVQAAFFLPAVIFGAHLAGIKGVAIAADAMLLVGVWCIYRPLVETIDFSTWHLFGWPVLALTIALGTGVVLESIVDVTLWQLVLLKIGIFTIVFSGILLLVEWKDYVINVQEVWEILKPDTMK